MSYTNLFRISLNSITTKSHGGIIRKIFLVVLMFMFVYSFSPFLNFQELTSTRIASVLILLWGICSSPKAFHIVIGKTAAERTFRNYLFLNIFLLLYTGFLLILWGPASGDTVTNIYINILIFSLMFYYGSKYIFHDLDELMEIILIVTLIQCTVIFSGLLSSSVNEWIREHFYANSYFEVTGKLSSMRGYALGIGCITSKGSQKLSLGIISCVYYLVKKQKNLKYLFYLVIITLASTAVSRTGFVFSALAVFYVFSISIQKNPKKAKALFQKALGVLISATIFVIVFRLQDRLSEILWRFMTLLNGGISSFFEGYFSGNETVIPELSFVTLLGTGVWSGMSGSGLMINADGGFARTYFSLGLVMAAIYYCFLLRIFIMGMKNIEKFYRYLCYLLLIFMFIGEFKEPLLFDWYYQTVFFVIVLLAEKNNLIKSKTNCLTI